MTLELASIPLAFLAGILGVMSPCVWPLVPVVMSSSATTGRSGPLFLALGLAAAFAVAGTFLTFLLLNAGLNPDAYRYFAAVLMILIALLLLIRQLGDPLTLQLSRFTGRFHIANKAATTATGQFGVGALLGFVWLPCVGPTLGAAIALASMGQEMGMAFLIMFTFGLGTAAALLLAGYVFVGVFNRYRPGVMKSATRGKQILGAVLLLLGIMVFTGIDKILEAYALQMLPDWAITL
ncbi:MAG: cytochrome c biogenesis protein CcdA [Balneolales bacterium]